MKTIYKLYKWTKKHIFLSISILFLCTLLPIFVINLLFWMGPILGRYSIKSFYSPTDILMYYSNILGSVIGALVAFGGLYITIRRENRERIEDRRLTVLPYLEFNILNDIRGDVIQNIVINKSNKNKINNELFFSLKIKNVGLGCAFNVYLNKISYSNNNDIPSVSVGNLLIGEVLYISFQVIDDDLNDIEKNNIGILTSFETVLGDYYEQNISIECNFKHANNTIEHSNAYIEKNNEPKFRYHIESK